MPTIESREEKRASALDTLGLGQLRGQGTAFKVAAGGLVVVFLACFLPWVSESYLGSPLVGFSLFEGRWVLAAVVIGGFLLYRFAHDYEPIKLVGAGIASLVVFLGVLSYFVTAELLTDSSSGFPGDDRPGRQTGVGLWASIIGGGLAVGGIAAMLRDLVGRGMRRSEAATREADEPDEAPLPPPD